MSRIIAPNNPGKCRVCGCTELKPCLYQVAQGEPLVTCSWMDAEKTLCTNLRCIGATSLGELMRMKAAAA